jgi:hypothetical protein
MQNLSAQGTPLDTAAGVWSAGKADLKQDSAKGPFRVTFQPAEWPSVHFKPSQPLDWSKTGTFVVDVTNPGTKPVTFGVRVDDEPSADGNKHTRQGMTTAEPGSTVSYALTIGVDPKGYGMNGLPKPRGLRSIATSGGPDFNPAHIIDIQFFLHNPESPTSLTFANLRLLPAPSMVGVVDKYGQYTGATWPDKVTQDSDFKARAAKEELDLAKNLGVGGRDRFGGWAEGPKRNATGFFRTEKIDGRWWLIDPDGRLFFSAGVDVVVADGKTFITGRESMFSSLPKAGEPFSEFYSQDRTDHGGKSFSGQTYDFYSANLKRKFGADLKQELHKLALRRLPSWGFNTIGNWSDRALYRNGKVPYVATVWVWGNHKRVASGNDYWGKMHDPFDPEFRVSTASAIGEVSATIKGDPWCLGVFVDNELSWAGEGPDEGRYGLAIGALSYGKESSAKMALVDQLKSKHRTIEALNNAWKTIFASWDAITEPAKGPWEFTEAQKQDLSAFVYSLSDRYHQVVKEELKKADPDHLYLGCRFAWYGKEAVAAAVKHTDVISFNIYASKLDSAKWEWTKTLDRPVIIGEFHFGATDRGMFHPGLVDAVTQDGRAAMYKSYVTSVLNHPSFVGCHWFQYVDEPLTGRTLDGENYQIGMVDVSDTPYEGAVEAARQIHRQIYKLHSAAR